MSEHEVRSSSKVRLRSNLIESPDEIVISGIGGRYPDSDNVDEFWSKLMSGVELSTIDDTRWTTGEFSFAISN